MIEIFVAFLVGALAGYWAKPKDPELQQQIDNKGTAQAMAPIINKPTTNINKSTTNTSVRLHPRNQESTFRNYINARYAI